VSAEAARVRLEASGLTKRFGDRPAVDGLGFRVARGEILGFLGPNGAGKTTTFNLLSGLLSPDAGRVQLEGVEVPLGGRELRTRMGIVFQHPSLDPKLTGRENLEMGAALYGVTGAKAKERIARGLESSELTARADDPVERYSGGMRRRLELARVLLHDPEILLMDEPTQGLDVGATRRIWRQLLDLRAQTGLTILLTTHSPEEAEHCDRILVLDRGKVIAEGSPDELRGQVGGDVITLGGEDLDGLVEGLKTKLSLEAKIADGAVVLEHEAAQEIVPRIFEAFPRGRIASVAMRQASLGDVFLKLTGKTIDGADQDEAARKEATSKKGRRSA
jgi:ABC-2 type transport system ATP-binding protein